MDVIEELALLMTINKTVRINGEKARQKMEKCTIDTEKIKALLKKQGITQRELAERAKITEASVSRYLSGQRVLRILTFASIAQVLGVNINELITERRRV